MTLWMNWETCLCLYRMVDITLPAAVKLISKEIEVFLPDVSEILFIIQTLAKP